MDSGDIVSLRVRIQGGHAGSASAQVLFSPPSPHLALTDPCLSRAAETARLRERERGNTCVSLCSSAYIPAAARGQDCLSEVPSDNISIFPPCASSPHISVSLPCSPCLVLTNHALCTVAVLLPFFLYSTETRCLQRLSDKINHFFFLHGSLCPPTTAPCPREGTRMAA